MDLKIPVSEENENNSKNSIVDVNKSPVQISLSTGMPFKNFEDSLQRLGGFGWFQIWALFLILIPEIPAGMIAMMPVFVGTSHTEFVCRDPGNFNIKQEDRILFGNDPQLCGTLLPWQSFIIHTISKWVLICERTWITDLFTSIQMLGMMAGAFLASQLADRFGRKTVFYGAVATMGFFCLASAWAQDIYTYASLKFITGVGVGGFYVVYQIYLMEFLTPNWRTLAGCLTIWSIGIILLALLAYLLPSWRHLTLAGSAPALLLVLFYPTMPESPRWLLCQQRTEDARKAFKQIAWMNKKEELDAASMAQLQEIILQEKESEDKDTKNQSPSDLYLNAKLRNQLGLFIFGWFTVAFVYYGMSFNTKNLSGNPYLNVLYLGLVDLPAFPSGVLFNNWLGRRKTYAGYLTFASVFLVALVTVDMTMDSQNSETIITMLQFLGRFGIAGAWGIVMCFTAEAFPTVCRSTALGFCALSANIGGVLAPQLAYFGTISTSTPYFIFAGLSLAAVCSTFLLPETNKKMLQNFVH